MTEVCSQDGLGEDEAGLSSRHHSIDSAASWPEDPVRFADSAPPPPATGEGVLCYFVTRSLDFRHSCFVTSSFEDPPPPRGLGTSPVGDGGGVTWSLRHYVTLSLRHFRAVER